MVFLVFRKVRAVTDEEDIVEMDSDEQAAGGRVEREDNRDERLTAPAGSSGAWNPFNNVDASSCL
jgi:hypothetical protein